MTKILSILIIAGAAIGFTKAAYAQNPEALSAVPTELRDWVPWVKQQHTDLDCAALFEGTQCVWPGKLTIQANANDGGFELKLRSDNRSLVALPVAKTAWPMQVKVNGKPTSVLDKLNRPYVYVSKGFNTITGSYTWKEMPTTLDIPTTIATLNLTVEGEQFVNPKLSEGGSLRLSSGTQVTSEKNTLVLDVSRKIDDGIPLIIHTQITVRASGDTREVNLGQVLVPNTEPVELSSQIPARLDDDSNLILRIRPGNHTVSLKAKYNGNTDKITAPSVPAPWPEVEYWAVSPNDRVRAADLSGPTGIDPVRTTLPPEWHSLRTFQVTPDQPLLIKELRRGEPNPAPNKLNLVREFWLDHDGHGWTIRDRFSGSMSQDWRLSVDPIANLGHVSDHGIDQVITQKDAAGVELRKSDISLVAESRIEGKVRNFSAVGWNTDVHTLNARINLPPGYSLLTAIGVDNLDGSVLNRWNLFDLFFVLILSLAIGKMFGFKWGLIAVLGLTLARHEIDAPAWLWVFLISTSSLGKALPTGTIGEIIQITKWLFVALLLTVISVFSVQQIQNGLFPQLHPDLANISQFSTEELGYFDSDLANAAPAMAGAVQSKMYEGKTQRMRSSPTAEKGLSIQKRKSKYLSSQVDPNAVVQTGPGVPDWSWVNQPLQWSGPVDKSHTIRLFVLSPLTNTLLAFLRVGLLLILTLKLAELRTFKVPTFLLPPMAALLLTTLYLPNAYAAIPSPELLIELDQRLFEITPDDTEDVSNPVLNLRVEDDQLTLVAEIHAASITAWAIPGPASAWVPTSVTVNGRITQDLARLDNGYLYVRLEPGIHQVVVTGPLGNISSKALTFQVKPKHLTWSGSGWELAGQKADGTVEDWVQLIRATSADDDSIESRTAEHLVPWLEVHRRLDLGIPWIVRTLVTRKGPSIEPLTTSIPLLAGEAVTSDNFEVNDGSIQITMERGAKSVEWVSTLKHSETISLSAPSGVPWTERWSLLCSPIFACTATDGPAPLHHVDADEWAPEWLVWPGESVNLSITRPEAATGQTITIDKAAITVSPGRRQQESSLVLRIRTSQGGQQQLSLPAGAELQSVTIEGTKMPLQMQDSKVRLPLKPGLQSIEVNWLEHVGTTTLQVTPLVDLGGQAVNAIVTVNFPKERWIAALSGPSMGPVPLYWTYIILVMLAAALLGRLPWAPLNTWQWALLGLGMTQVPIIAPLIIVIWFMALGHRGTYRHPNWLIFNTWQFVLIGLTFTALVTLYFAIHSGLLWAPNMQVSGNNSSEHHLVWYIDRINSTMPQATIVSFPMWVWRILMLAWSLWLAANMVRWLPWAWKAFAWKGLVELPPKRRRKVALEKPEDQEDPVTTDGGEPTTNT